MPRDKIVIPEKWKEHPEQRDDDVMERFRRELARAFPVKELDEEDDAGFRPTQSKT